MKVIYRGECEELYGCEIEVEDHECIEHLEYRCADHMETHGLDCGPYEHVFEEWLECAICHDRYDVAEVDRMMDFARENIDFPGEEELQ